MPSLDFAAIVVNSDHDIGFACDFAKIDRTDGRVDKGEVTLPDAQAKPYGCTSHMSGKGLTSLLCLTLVGGCGTGAKIDYVIDGLVEIEASCDGESGCKE